MYLCEQAEYEHDQGEGEGRGGGGWREKKRMKKSNGKKLKKEWNRKEEEDKVR